MELNSTKSGSFHRFISKINPIHIFFFNIRQGKVKIEGYVEDAKPKYLVDDSKRFFSLEYLPFQEIFEKFHFITSSFQHGKAIPIYKQLHIVL